MNSSGGLSKHLPYDGFNDDTGSYHNCDGSRGYIWECVPLAACGVQSVAILHGLLLWTLPCKSLLQFTLFTDYNTGPILEQHQKYMVRNHPIVQGVAGSLSKILENGLGTRKTHMADAAARYFRLMVSLRIPADASAQTAVDAARAVYGGLESAGLAPGLLKPKSLMLWLRQILTGTIGGLPTTSKGPLRCQILPVGTTVHHNGDLITVGRNNMRCLSVKNFPLEVKFDQTSRLFGDPLSSHAGFSQIDAPFFYTLSIRAGSEQLQSPLSQQGCHQEDPLAVESRRRIPSERYLRITPLIWTWDCDDSLCQHAIRSITKIWGREGYLLQEECTELPTRLAASLPLGDNAQASGETRDFIAPAATIANLLPIHGESAGAGGPVQLLVGRKGQVASLDLFNTGAANCNAIITGSLTAGTCTLLNALLLSHFGAGTRVRVIEPYPGCTGLAKAVGGDVVILDHHHPISLNPFSCLRDKDAVIFLASSLVEEICGRSRTGSSEQIAVLSRHAAHYAWGLKGSGAGVDDIHDYLADLASKESLAWASDREWQATAFAMSVQLEAYTSGEAYGAWFNGPSSLSFVNDFILFDLEVIRRAPNDLFDIIMMTLLLLCRDEFAQKDLQPEKKLLAITDAWCSLAGPAVPRALDLCYRKAASCNASIIVEISSLIDLAKIKGSGALVRDHSASTLYLAGNDYDQAHYERVIDCDSHTLIQLKRLSAPTREFVEFFLATATGGGVFRMPLDPFSRCICNAEPHIDQEIARMVKDGCAVAAAITAVVSRHAALAGTNS